jgi:tetratricopeptide (TPR) repeat protein
VTGYHVVNLLIHLAAGLILYALIRRTFRLPVLQSRHAEQSADRIAAFAALIWIVHPVQTQAVTYVVQRATSLATLFYLLTLLAYVKGRTVDGRAKRWWFLAALGSAALAFASKEIAFTLPVVVILYDALFLCGAEWAAVRRRWRIYAAVLAPAMVIAGAFLSLKGSALFTDYAVPQDFTVMERVLTEGRVLVHYLTLLAYPAPSRLSLDYYIPVSTSLIDPLSTLFSWAAIVGLLTVAVALVRRAPLAAFCILWFLINLAMESTVIMLDLAFEHRLYLPSIGVAVLASTGAETLMSQLRPGTVVRRAALGAMAALVLLFGAWTWERNAVWSDRAGLWEDAARKYPDNPRAWFNLGALYVRDGRTRQAFQAFERAIALRPQFRSTLAREVYRSHRFLLNKGLRRDALQVMAWGEDTLPDDGIVHYAVGSYLLETQGAAAALERLQKAVERTPNEAVIYDKLGMAYFQLGEFDRGRDALARAIQLRPSLTDTYQDIAEAYRRRRGDDVAAGLYQAILAVQPDRLDVARKLGEIRQGSRMSSNLEQGGSR